MYDNFKRKGEFLGVANVTHLKRYCHTFVMEEVD